MDKDLKKILQKVEIPPFEEEALRAAIIRAENVRVHPSHYIISTGEFLFSQIAFIQLKTWVLKLMITFIVFVLLSLKGASLNHWTWPLIAIFGPLICVINANEIYQTLQPGMLELHMTTHYSARSVLLVRLLVFGLCDFVFLLIASVMLRHFQGVSYFQVLIYGSLPYLLMCLGSLMIANRCSEENIILYSTGFAISLNIAVVLAKITEFNLYSDDCTKLWITTELAIVIGLVIEFRKLIRKVNGNVSEIKTRLSY